MLYPNRNGETAKTFAFGGDEVQRLMLEEEGVEFNSDGRIDLKKFSI